MGAFLAVLLLVSALCQIDRILPFVLAESMKLDLGLSDTQLGLINGIAFSVCYSLASLPLARAADRGSPKWVLILCLLGWSAMTSLGGLATGFGFLAISRLGVAFGESGGIPSAHALIAREITPGRRGLAIGLFSMGIPLGAMLGFAIGGLAGDTIGWRAAMIGSGAAGGVLALLVALVVRPTPPIKRAGATAGSFLRSALLLLSSPAFRWLFIGANLVGLASAPFYAFAVPFLIRVHGLSASEAGLAFGLLQGLLGLVGTVVGGRGFDRAVRAGRGQVLRAPSVAFLVAAVATLAALFAPEGWMSIALLAPVMFSFTFMLPWAFGSAHLVAGPGKQALASGVVLIGSGLLGPTLGPLLVGLASDAAAAARIPDSLRWGLLVVPLATACAGIVLLIANRCVAAHIVRNTEPVHE